MTRPVRSQGGRRLRFTEEEQTHIRKRYEEGASCNAIASEIDCNHKSLTVFLARNGIEFERRWPKGRKHPNWEGGRYLDRDGYVALRLEPGDPRSGMANAVNQVREHRLVMANHLGRDLRSDETVHHKNGIRDDNQLENLELMTHMHPHGQRVEDKVKFALAVLSRYAPERLRDGD